MTDEELCAEYYRVAGAAADPCVDVDGLRAVAALASAYADGRALGLEQLADRERDARIEERCQLTRRAEIAEARAAYWKAAAWAWEVRSEAGSLAERNEADRGEEDALTKLREFGVAP